MGDPEDEQNLQFLTYFDILEAQRMNKHENSEVFQDFAGPKDKEAYHSLHFLSFRRSRG